jgi:ABC-type multidrug transport system fused ATPase/permease subunit
MNILKILNKRNRLNLGIIVILTIILSFLEFLVFSFIEPIINSFSQNVNNQKINFFFINNLELKKLLIIFFILYLTRVFFAITLAYLRSFTLKKIFDDISLKILTNYLDQKFIFFLNKKYSQLLSNITIEVNKFSNHYIESSIHIFTESFIVITIVIFLFTSYFTATFLIVIFIFSSFGIFYYLYKDKFKDLGEQRSIQDSNRMETLKNIFDTIQIVKLYNQEDLLRNSFDRSSKILSKSDFHLRFASELPKNFIELLLLIVISFIIFFFYFVLNFDKSQIFSMLGLYAVAMFRLVPSCNRIFHSLNSIKYFKPSVQIVSTELNLIKPTKNFFKDKPFKMKESLKLNNINFTFPNTEKKILRNINLEIFKGQIIGINGPSGSGKSTLLYIICGLLEPSLGKIILDDTELNERNFVYFQNKIGLVPQKNFLINDTIYKNIVLSDEGSHNDKMLERSIKLSNLSEVITSKSEGLNYLVGNDGMNLSGGQQQRICLARALYKNPDLLILDEATSALDWENTKSILNSVNNLKTKDISVVLVSHNSGHLEICDKVFNLNNGELKEI